MKVLIIKPRKLQVLTLLFFVFIFSCSDDDVLLEKLTFQEPPPELSSQTLEDTDKPVSEPTENDDEKTVHEEEPGSLPFTENDSTETETPEVPVNPETDKIQNLPCSTGSKSAEESGPRVWCWDNILIPSQEGFFDDYKLFVSSHCSSNMVTKNDGRVHFKVTPSSLKTPTNCGPYNYRAEIREHPSDVDYPIGTEQWWGFDYKFDENYQPDELPWIMWQTHGSFSSPSNPMTNLQLGPTNYSDNVNPVGELFVVNNTPISGRKFTPVGIVPKGGQTLKIVIHLVWGDESNGLYEVWIDGNKVYSKHERTVYTEKPYGGYWKIGIYKWRWKTEGNVSASQSLGISSLNTSIGPLRTIMRKPGDPDYAKDSYNLVVPD